MSQTATLPDVYEPHASVSQRYHQICIYDGCWLSEAAIVLSEAAIVLPTYYWTYERGFCIVHEVTSILYKRNIGCRAVLVTRAGIG